MMALRLLELHRVLKPTGSIYLHCDPTASHYLKILMDGIFGKEHFRNEIIWRRTNAHNKLSRQYGPIHDTLLFYAKSNMSVFHLGRRPYTMSYVKESFPYSDTRGMYQSNVLTGAGIRHGESGQAWRHYNPTAKGRHWAIPGKLLAALRIQVGTETLHNILELLDEAGFILHPAHHTSLPRYKQYLDSSEGILFQDIWAYQPGTAGILYKTEEGIDQDIKWLDADEERLGYQTQKPLGLLERIIVTSSNPNDIVMDPFCGCGTAIHAAQKLDRRWIGIDITHLAISLIETRLNDGFPGIMYDVYGTPQDLDGAKALAARDKYQFQWWAVSLVNAMPYGGKKKGADSGIDGIIYFKPDGKKTDKAIVSVKGGARVSVDMIRELAHVVEREQAKLGVFISLACPTGPMQTEATKAGFYMTPYHGKLPKIQVFTIADLFAGKRPTIPFIDPATFRRSRPEETTQQAKLFA